MKKNKGWLKKKAQSQVVVITFLCVVCCIMMLATIAVCTVNILTMAGRDDPVYHSSIMLSLITEGISLIVTAAFILLCIYVKKAIVKPIRKISNELNNFSEGILSAEFDVKINDSDIGKLAGSLNTAKWYLKKMVDELTYLLTQMSYGNISFTINYDYKGEFTPIKSAFEQILVNLNDSFSRIQKAGTMLYDASEQVSSGSQALAQGTSEQEASIRELSDYVQDISGKVNKNAENAKNVSEISDTATNDLKEGNAEMQKMLAAMKIIDEKSVEIEKIINTIDNIAFQTNILSLNAAIEAARRGRGFILQSDIKGAFIKVGIGAEKKSKVISEKEKKITAYHESGHAILFHVLPDMDPVYTISIIPTGMGAAGYTMPLPDNDEMFNTKGKMLQDIMTLLGGRIAEEIIFGDITTGASNDIKRATATARSMVMKYGMSDKLGLICYGDDDDEVFIGRDLAHTRSYSEDVAKSIDEEIRRIISECHDQAKKIILEHEDVLHKCASLLLEKEKVHRDEFEALFTTENPETENNSI